MRMGLGLGLGSGQRRAGGYSAEANAYFAVMNAQGDAKYKAWINTLILKLKGANTYGLNIFSVIDDLRLYANKDEDASYINLVKPTDTKAAKLGTPTFTQYQGWNALGGAGNAINLKTLISGKTNFGLNLGSMFFYTRTDPATGTYDFGSTANNYTMIGHINGQIRMHHNQNYTTGRDLGANSTKGLICGVKKTATTARAFKNGVAVGDSDVTVPASTNFCIGGIISNARGTGTDIDNPGVDLPSSRELAVVGYGAVITDSQNAALYECIAWALQNSPAGDKR